MTRNIDTIENLQSISPSTVNAGVTPGVQVGISQQMPRETIFIFYSGSNADELFRIINHELVHVVRWFKVNRLSVNLKKTNFVIFGNTSKLKNLDNYEIFLDSTVIERKTYAKFLGVIVDDKLTWNNHIECIEGKVAKNIGIIRKVQSVFPTSMLN